MANVCTCGDPEKHVIARRKTADDKIVCLWDDGALTWALGHYIKGGCHPRTDEQRAFARDVGWLVMGEVELYDAEEVTDLIKAARWAVKRGLDVEAMRLRMNPAPIIKPVWTVLATDRDGRPTLRVWRLPRMRWPGMAVWDGAHADSQGRYSIMHEIGRSGTYEPSGVRFHTLEQVTAHLLSFDRIVSA